MVCRRQTGVLHRLKSSPLHPTGPRPPDPQHCQVLDQPAPRLNRPEGADPRPFPWPASSTLASPTYGLRALVPQQPRLLGPGDHHLLPQDTIPSTATRTIQSSIIRLEHSVRLNFSKLWSFLKYLIIFRAKANGR